MLRQESVNQLWTISIDVDQVGLFGSDSDTMLNYVYFQQVAYLSCILVKIFSNGVKHFVSNNINHDSIIKTVKIMLKI